MSVKPAAALVILRQPLEDRELVAQNIGAFTPEPDAVERARRFFADAGLQVGPLVGISFSISGPPERLRALFEDWDDRVAESGDLSMRRLPEDVRDVIQAVTIEPPVELHYQER